MSTVFYARALSLHAERDPGRPALVCDGCTFTRDDLDRPSNRMARVFQARGVEQSGGEGRDR
jgi:hypothetical protein